ncbi:MAG: 16S rRNA (guanine(527)-N(7))-methyltransferase RsmG [Pseudomonadota bacterium]
MSLRFQNPHLTERLNTGAACLGSPLTGSQAEQCLAYLGLLAHWNRRYNLTAITDPVAMVDGHLIDSFSIRPYLAGQRVLDVGSGAGLPGIPLAIVEPGRQFVLLDGSIKKARFLRQVQMELGLGNVEVVAERAEVYRPTVRFDCITVRAVGALADLLACTSHLIARPGQWLLMKGRYPAVELAALEGGPESCQVIPLPAVPGLDKARHLVILGTAPDVERGVPSLSPSVSRDYFNLSRASRRSGDS